LIIRRLIVPLTAAVVIAHASQALAQSAFPAPLPSGGVIKNDPAFRRSTARPLPARSARPLPVRFRSTAQRRSPVRHSSADRRPLRRREPATNA